MPLSIDSNSEANGAPSSVALAIERAGRKAARRAIREHLRAGRAVYYADPAYPEGTVKELPSGQRLLVRLEKPARGQPSGEGSPETVLREIEPRGEDAEAANEDDT